MTKSGRTASKSAREETSRAAPSPDVRLDELLREAYDPGPGVAERIVRGALAEDVPAGEGATGTGTHRNPWTGTAALGFAVVAVLLLATALWLAVPTDPPTIQEPPRPAAARLSITNDHGTVTVTAADGTRWISFQPATDPTGDPSS